MKVVLASTNQGKLKEFANLSRGEDWLELVLAPEGFNPEETGKTFIENAQIKARAAAEITAQMSIADDSGLIVEALDGRPGIYSARYCPGTDADRRTKLLGEMEKVPDGKRQAAFLCAMAVCDPDGSIVFNSIRYWEGYIGRAEKGESGFGYDPIFYLNNTQTTAAELSEEEKNQLSHRGKAFRHVLSFLKDRYEGTKS